MRAVLRVLPLLVGLMLHETVPRAAVGQAAGTAPAADAEDRRLIAQLLTALERSPRRGVVLDRVYGLHVERGRLDELIRRYRESARGDRPEGVAAMIVGLLEAQRGRDAAAVEAFREAERLRPDDAMASYYLGQSLLLIGRPAEADEALERAIARKPSNRNDLLEIYQALGRLHQRAQRTEQALAVWRRLEQQFPDDLRVRERIAAALAEDGQLEPALARYQALAANAEERLKQPLFRIAAADLKARLGRRAESIADFEALLADLPLEDWLHRDTRRRLEEIFLRHDDISGLVAYYTERTTRHPDDLDALARLAHHLESLGRGPEARHRLEDGLRRAPSDTELRMALIGLLVDQQKTAEAVAQYEQLDRVDANNPDHLREWGRLILRDPSKPEAERRQAAAGVWRRLLPGQGRRPDAAATEQVADLFRQAGMVDEALALYRRAVEIAPDVASPRIHLGEYLHSLDRKVEALATWKPIAEGTRRDARGLKTLADVLSDFSYRAEAIEALTAARVLSPNDLGLVLQLAEVHHRSGQYAEALKVLEAGARLADSPDQAEQVLDRRIQAEQMAGTLQERAIALEKSLSEGRESGVEPWYRLARFREAARQWPAAAAAIRRARDGLGPAAPGQAPIWSTAARILEGAGQLSEAADALRRLADVDPKNRSDALRQVARIESKLNHRDAALQAGRDLLAAAAGNAEHYRFFADLCFQLDERDEGIAVLRRAVRADANDPAPLLALAQALAVSGRSDEAIELDWRAFEKTEDVVGKRTVVGALAELYLGVNQFDRLLERLERLRRDRDRVPEQRRSLTLCIAQAHQTAGDLGTARRELERLLADYPTDVTLLQQLTALAEKEGDLSAALRFQQQMVKVSPRGARDHLVSLLLQLGEVDEAVAIWRREAESAQGTRRLLELTDNLLFFGQADRAMPLIVRVLRDRPQDWEALYREGVALVGSKHPDEAARRFQAILDLQRPDEEPSVLISAGAAGSKGRTRDADDAVFDRVDVGPKIRQEIGLDIREQVRKTFWTPGDFGQARMAALAWLHTLSRRTNTTRAFLAGLRARRDARGTDLRGWWDWFYLHSVLADYPRTREAARVLVKTGEAPTQRLFLMYLANSVNALFVEDEVVTFAAPLTAAEVDQVAASLRFLLQHRPDWVDAQVLLPALAALKQAGRSRDEAAFFGDAVASAIRSRQIVSLMSVAGNRGDGDSLLQLFRKLDGRSWPSTGPNIYPSHAIGQAFMVAMDARAEAGSLDDVGRLVDGLLDSNRRRSQAARARSTRPPLLGDPVGLQEYYVGDYRRTLSMEFPSGTDFLGRDELSTLGDAFMLFDRVDRVEDMLAHVRGRLARAAPADRPYEYLVLCGLNWWNEARDEALAELRRAVTAAPADPVLRLELARMHETLGQPDEALAVIEETPTPDQAALRLREMAALRVAVRTGKIDRARLAAERLFVLRLDPATGVQVATSMQQVGLKDQAAELLDRVRTQAGGRIEILMSLMGQYQALNRPEAAAEVAYQILRISGPTRSQSRFGVTYYSSDGRELARPQALAFLARSGRLAPLIARAEAQLQATPRSNHLMQTLREYYLAVGDAAKARSTLERMLALKLDDPSARIELASELAATGATKDILEHYLAALRAQPGLFGDWRIPNLLTYQFQSAGRLPELVAVLDKADLGEAGLREFVQILATMIDQPATRSEGLRLLRSIARRPGYVRGTIIGALGSSSYVMSTVGRKILATPELFEILRDEIVPQADEPTPTAWSGISSVVPIFLYQAASQGRLSDLADAVGRAASSRPDWHDGQALLALIDVHRGLHDKARTRLLPLLDAKGVPIPAPVRRLLVRELEGGAELHDIALRLVEGESDSKMANGMAAYQGSLTRIQVNLLRAIGRPDKSRELAMTTFRAVARGRIDATGMYTSRRVRNLDAIGRHLLELGFPVDAVRVYGSTLDREPIASQPVTINEGEWGWIAWGLDRSLQAVRAADASTILDDLVVESTRDGPAVDLLAFVSPRDPERTALVSVLDDLVKRAASEPGLLGEAGARLDRVRAARPRDLAAHVAAALVALAAGRDEAAAVRRLEGLVGEMPLVELAPGKRATARQRAAAAEQIVLWLVARDCLRRDALRPAGLRLGTRALDAARRQHEAGSALAILREWGQLEHDRGDRAAGDARWAELVATLDSHAKARPKPPAAAGRNRSASPMRRQDADLRLRLAAMAARNDSIDLSMRVAGEVLHHGPPAEPAAGNRAFGTETQRGAEGQVDARLLELDDLWREHHASADRAYETLVSIILPESRPAEVFLYARPIVDPTTVDAPAPAHVARVHARSAGERLVDWAVRAGRVDDLRRRAEARMGQPTAEVPARVLIAQLAVLDRDPKRAVESLQGLRVRLEKESVGSSAELACHAALPALHSPGTTPAAQALLERALVVLTSVEGNVDRFRGTTQNRYSELSGIVRVELSRARFRAGDLAGGRKFIRQIIDEAARTTARYSDFNTRRSFLHAALDESIGAGQWDDAWELLGRWLDASWDGTGNDFPAAAFKRMTAELATRPKAVRYEFTRTWVLPAGQRKTLRFGLATAGVRDRPAVQDPDRDAPMSTFGLLVDAARSAGQLDALAAAVKPLVEQKTAHAESLALLIDVASGRPDDAASRVRRRADELKERAARLDEAARSMAEYRMYGGTASMPEHAGDALVVLACLAEPKLREIGVAMADPLTRLLDQYSALPGLSSLLHRETAAFRLGRALGAERVAAAELGLSLWRPDAAPEIGGPASGWIEHEGHLRLIPGSPPSPLRFAYPLAGTFEFSFEATGAGHAAFGGQSFPRPETLARALSPGRFLPSPDPDRGTFHRHRLRVGPDKLRCWIDGRLIYESDDLGRGSPWLTLLSGNSPGQPAVFRNLTLTGNPEIPGEVRLLDGRSLRWNAVPSAPLGTSVMALDWGPLYDDDDNPNSFIWRSPPLTQPVPPRPAWSSKQGRLIADRILIAGPDHLPNRLDYDRPLRSGESIRYEFLHEPGATMVHPALGRVVFVLEADGVRVHGPGWGTGIPEREGGGSVTDPGRSLRPMPPLNPGAWNEVVLSLRGDTVTLVLNGVAIHERQLDRGDVPHFGLFHLRDRTAAQVRDLVLRGDWPGSLTPAQLTDLTARTGGPGPMPERRVRQAWLGDSTLRRNALAVLTRNRALSPPRRYEALRAWVLPDGGLAPPRLEGVFPPGDPPPPVAGAIPTSPNLFAAAAPAAELVVSARDAGRLDELESALRDAPGAAGASGREVTALAVLIAVARDRDDDARPALARLGSLLERTNADPEEASWPEFLAASAALPRPALRADASRLLDALTKSLDARKAQDVLSMQIRHLAAIARLEGAIREPAECAPTLSSWRSVEGGTSATRGDGFPRPFWTGRDGEVHHHPGSADDRLVFAVPLRGDFEVSCELNLDEGRSMQVVYGGLRLEVAPDGKSYQVRQDEGATRSFPLEPPLVSRSDWHLYRMTVRGGRAEIAIDGRPIHAARLPGAADPWLTLEQLGRREGSLRNLRITGNPEIPERLELAGGPSLAGWSAAYFGESMTGPAAAWEQVGSEIRGRRASVAAGLHQESLLQYRRPISEDGFIEYEFHHGLGHSMVHPALGRMVFVLEPEGVRLHWLTDGVHERTAMVADNRADEPAARRGPGRVPLRPGAWNRLRLTLAGDRVVLQLNGVDIYERELEPGNSRVFGLFHESDATDARVREIHYRGRWPRRLPRLDGTMHSGPPVDHGGTAKDNREGASR